MKNLDLNAYGVSEMSCQEMVNKNGGLTSPFQTDQYGNLVEIRQDWLGRIIIVGPFFPF
jgi:hypothetical protein